MVHHGIPVRCKVETSLLGFHDWFLVLTGFAEEVDSVRQLSFLQLQLTLLDELQQLLVPQYRELRRNLGPLLQDPALQLHVAIGNQLAHHWLALDLPRR